MQKAKILIVMVCTIIITALGTYAGMEWLEQNQDEEIKQENGTDRLIHPSETDADNVNLAKVEKAFGLIKASYVEEVDSSVLIEGAIEGMLSKLNDPYSVYMNEEKAKQFNSSLDSSFEGIGAEVSEVDGKIIIVSPYKHSPAEKAGLKPYDEILKVDGEAVTGWNLYDVTMKIRGKKGTKVTLEIAREGIKEPLTIEVTRDEIPIETVHASTLTEGKREIGYIEITSFSKDTGKDFKKELTALEKKQIDGLIIDVRGNPGGLLSSVSEIAGELVTNGKPMIQIENKQDEREKIYSKLKKRKPYPIVVLTDKGSASASEILAAALKEVEGYPTIGETTFGKGTVQQQLDLGDNSNIKLTMFKWLTPEGNWIHQKGVEPDIYIAQSNLYHLHPLQVEEPLRRDMNNEQIKNAQLILQSLGFETGRTDGYFSEATETAVKLFQQANNLTVTGRIDPKTAMRMEEKVLEEQQKPENDRQLQMALTYFKHYE